MNEAEYPSIDGLSGTCPHHEQDTEASAVAGSGLGKGVFRLENWRGEPSTDTRTQRRLS